MTDQETKVNTRALALDFLLETAEKGGYSHVVMRGMLEKYQYLDKKERAFLTRLSEGTLERMLELDAIIDKFSKVPVKKMKPVIRNLLRLSVYQLKYMDQIPDSDLYGRLNGCLIIIYMKRDRPIDLSLKKSVDIYRFFLFIF